MLRRLQAAAWATVFFAMCGAVQAQTCSIAGNDGPNPSITGIVNSYFPGASSAAVGATSISIGALNTSGSTTSIAPGDLLLIIQMQGADINTNDNNQYGDGAGDGTVQNSDVYGGANYAGGFLNNVNFTAGRYEFAVATSSSSGGGTVTLSAPLANSYVNGTRQLFQVVRVPQYSSATIGAGGLQAAPWNGASGGVVAIDVAGALSNTGGIDVSGRGFRGGGVINLTAQTNPQYSGYRNAYSAQSGGMKGEGISGTPAKTYSAVLGLSATAITDGYPSGDVGRGAPGNAGGGGNQHNSGGGGGANGGAGGRGGANWNSNVLNSDGPLRGGHGGSPPVTASTPGRLYMGGGGGAGDVGGNPSTDPQGSGGAGGGIIIVRAGTMSGSGTFNANGAPGIDVFSTDAAGGGGAGGTILVQVQSGSVTASLTATGGRGGNNTTGATNPEQDGPGGGGGGGVVYTNSAASGTVTSGVSGCLTSQSVSPGDAPVGGCARYYARAGSNGFSGSFSAPVAATGIYAGSACLPVLTATKSTSTPLIAAATGATATYTINVSNTGGGARNVSVIDNALPPGWALTGTPAYSYAPAGPLAAGNLAAGAETGTGIPASTFPLLTSPTVGTATPVTRPAAGANSLSWGTFFLPQNGSLSIVYSVSIANTAPAGTFHNPAGVTFLDPARAASSRIVAPLINNTANRTATAYSANTTYETGATSTVAGSSYSGLVAGPAAENVTLQADLQTTKTHNPATLVVGGTAQSYSVVVRNNGRAIRTLTYAADQASDATAQTLGGNPITLTDTLPTGVTLSAAPTSSSANWTCTGVAGATSFNCTQINAAYPLAAATDLATITVPINVAPTACPGPIVNTAVVSTAPVGESNTANNSGADSATANCTADIAITKTDNKGVTTPGATNTYVITLTNNGPSAANGAVVTDPASTGLSCTAVSCAASGGAVCPASGAGAGQLSVGNLQGTGVVVPTLPSAGVVTLTLTCTVTATGN